MPNKKEYSNEQYEKFLTTQYSSNFGISEEKVISTFMNASSTAQKRSAYGITVNNLKSTYIPYIKKELGSGAYVMFLLTVVAEGGSASLGWINYTYRPINGMVALEADVAYIKNLLTSKGKVNNWAPETGSCTLEQGAYDTYNKTIKGDIGRYYMVATLAGNACVWSNAWANTQYFGNPYDLIIDTIKKYGGDPFSGKNGKGSGGVVQDGGGNGGSAIIDKLKLPRAIYMQGSKFEFLGVKFKRYGNWLYITYPWDNITGQNNDNQKPITPETADREPTTNNIEKIMKELDKVKDKDFKYSNYRPAQSPLVSGTADCSSMDGWLVREVAPSLWNGGYTNTSVFVNYAKSHNLLIFEGNMNSVKSFNKWKAGDIILFGDDPSIGAGLSSHMAIIGRDNSTCYSMEPAGFIKKPISYMLNYWWSYRPYTYVMRFK